MLADGSCFAPLPHHQRNDGGAVQYTHTYGYDQVGNRILRNDGGSLSLAHGYDANDKLTMTRWVGGGPPGPITANFYYDGAGNMTSVTGTEFGSKTLTYDDESRLSSIAYGAVTDSYTYNWQGLRTRATLNGTTYRYLYNGDRVLQELTDAGAVNATYTTENDSYYGALLHLKRATGESRFPLYDEIGSARGLVDAAGAVTDTYDMDTFGSLRGSTGSTPNPYRFGAGWGYMTDPSGFLRLGARYYWPEVGRFVSQDPQGEGANWYTYVEDDPVNHTDPSGLAKCDEMRRRCLSAGREIAGTCRREATNTYNDCSRMCFDNWFPFSLGIGSAFAAGEAWEMGHIWTVSRATHLTNRMRNRLRESGPVTKRWAGYSAGAYLACQASCLAIRTWERRQCAKMAAADRRQCQRMYDACRERERRPCPHPQ